MFQRLIKITLEATSDLFTCMTPSSTLHLWNSTSVTSRRFSKNSERQDRQHEEVQLFQSSIKFKLQVFRWIQTKQSQEEEFPVLNNNKDVQQFLGLSGWYYQFVPNLSHRVEHLNALKHKGVKFNTWVSVCFWNPEDLSGLSTHFRASKLWLCVCCLTDASDMGLVAVLFRGPVLKPNNF